MASLFKYWLQSLCLDFSAFFLYFSDWTIQVPDTQNSRKRRNFVTFLLISSDKSYLLPKKCLYPNSGVQRWGGDVYTRGYYPPGSLISAKISWAFDIYIVFLRYIYSFFTPLRAGFQVTFFGGWGDSEREKMFISQFYAHPPWQKSSVRACIRIPSGRFFYV